MKGLELSRKFYEEYGIPLIENEFSDYKDRIAVGLVGHGSECFGFDDEISADHDFDAGFYIWLTKEDEEKFGFKLFRAYNNLPKEFLGIKRRQSSVYGGTKGVNIIEDFYAFYLPNGELPKTNEEWLHIPEFYLAEATNGEVFTDPLGEFTAVRNAILNEPEDVRLKKLSSALFHMAQAGQYNYKRLLSHGEEAAAALALSEFAKSTAEAVFKLNGKYMPYYKWMFRGLKALPILGSIADELHSLLKSPYDSEKNVPLIEKISMEAAAELRRQGLTELTLDFLEPYAYDIRDKIKDVNLRTSPIML